MNSQSATPKTSSKHLLKILLVDDQKFVQQKLQQMLSPQSDLKIVGIASDGESAIAQVEVLQPDVVLLDIEMPKMNGIEATEIISQRFPSCKILVLSSHENEAYVQKIISAGADGYILKSTSTQDLVMAIYAVCKGYSHFGSQLFKKIQLAPSENSGEINEPQIERSRITQTLVSGRVEGFLPPVSRWLIWGGISVISLIILSIPAAAVFKYKTIVKAPAVVRPAGELKLVQAAVEGQISEILVKQGQTVEKGQAIAIIDRSDFQTEQNQLTTSIEQQLLQLKQLNAQVASLESQIVAENARNQSQVAAAVAELEGSKRNYQDKNAEVTTQVAETQARVRAVKAALDAAVAKYNRYSSVAEAGAISQDLLAETRLEVEQQKQELEAAKANLQRAIAVLDPSNSDVNISRQRIEEAKRSGRATIAALNREREALIQQRIEIEKQLTQDKQERDRIERELAKTRIIATTAGTIFQLNLRNQGQTVQLGQEIAQIVPQNSSIVVKAAVATQDISKLEVGQQVQMRVSACPYPDYGTLGGKVSRIAKDTSKASKEPKANSIYEVTIDPNNRVFGRLNNQCSLQAGMEGRADIISREETLLQFILRKARLTADV